MQRLQYGAMLCGLLCLFALGGAQAQGEAKVDTASVVEYTTGVNPDNYPCAKAGILHLYEKRGKLADMSRFHPKRIFTWIAETSIYYTMRFVDFLKGLLNPDAVSNGIRNVHAMVTSGANPLAGLDRKVSGWARDLSPSSQYVLQRKVQAIIDDSTNEDGSCKL